MNGQPIVTDALVEQMLYRRAGGTAPVGLIEAIDVAVAETPQVHRRWWDRLREPAPRTPALRLALILALVGLLLATAAGVALIGSGLLPRPADLSVVPPGSVTSSAFGPITWRPLEVPGPGIWWPITGTQHGPLAVVEREVGEGHVDDLLWPGADGSWRRLTLPDDASGLHPVDGDVIVATVGESPAFWLRWSRSAWAVGEPVNRSAVDVNDVATGPRGVLLTDGTEIQYSSDGSRFDLAVRPPDKTKLQPNAAGCTVVGSSSSGEGAIGSMIGTAQGFVALTAADPWDWNDWPTCEPVLWQSTNGSAWELVAPVTPFGSGAYVSEVASRAGRHVAIGGVGPSDDAPHSNAVWASDDGLTWDRLAMPEPAGACPLPGALLCGHVYSRVVAGEAGWIILDYEGFAWTSADGRAWEAAAGWPKVPAGYLPQGLALSPGSIVETSVGEVGVIGTFEP